MKKDFFYILLILVLIKAAASPIPDLLSQPENKETSPTIAKPNSEKPADIANCDLLDKQGSDDLSALTNQASTKTNACLFLGCNGFF